MELVSFIVSAVLISIGVVMEIIAVFGVFTQKNVLPRMHAAAIGDTGALGCIILGLMIRSGFNLYSLKLFFVWIFLWLGSAVTSHMLSKMMIVGNEEEVREYNEFLMED